MDGEVSLVCENQDNKSPADLWWMVQAHLSDETSRVAAIFICIFQYIQKHKLLQGWTSCNRTFDGHQLNKNKTFADQEALIHPNKHDLFFVWRWERSCWWLEPPQTGHFSVLCLDYLSLEPQGSSCGLRFIIYYPYCGIQSTSKTNQPSILNHNQPELTNATIGQQQRPQQHEGWTAIRRRLLFS